MRLAGVPPWMFDTKQELQAYMVLGLSAAEVEAKLGTAWERVQNGPGRLCAST